MYDAVPIVPPITTGWRTGATPQESLDHSAQERE